MICLDVQEVKSCACDAMVQAIVMLHDYLFLATFMVNPVQIYVTGIHAQIKEASERVKRAHSLHIYIAIHAS